MRILIIAGEASGDAHGSGVVRELQKQNPAIEIYGIGGDAMEKEGMKLLHHVKELSVMGFVEVVKHIPDIRRIEKNLLFTLQKKKTDAVLLIDYPGFNLRFAKKAKELGLKVFYYISPQIWAWKRGRLKTMKHFIDKMFVVFSFEKKIYEQATIPVSFVGHPLLEEINEQPTKAEFITNNSLSINKKIVGIFPGSRKQEIQKIFPTLVETGLMLQKINNVQCIVGVAPTLQSSYLKKIDSRSSEFIFVENQSHALMKHSDVAMVTSGTATLETAIFQTPMMIVYKTSPITYAIGKRLVNITHIGLVNIVAGEEVVKEFVQHKATAENLYNEAVELLQNEEKRITMKRALATVKNKLGEKGAAKHVAEEILKQLVLQ
ncbi:MAG: lipid-A-disaccharide synthase [Bacteroidota bacterium]